MKHLFLLAMMGGLLVSCKKNNSKIELKSHDSDEMMGIMHQMMSKMDTMQKTNDPEIDFAKMMRMHHQGAIDMANLELQKGSNDSLKKTAQKIINEQQAEIQQLNAILASLSPDNSDPSFTMELMEAMQKGSKAADVQLITGDIDNDFATLMIGHHQTAIDNASAYLHHGNNAQLKTMANNIVSSQTREIQELADWLKSNKR